MKRRYMALIGVLIAGKALSMYIDAHTPPAPDPSKISTAVDLHCPKVTPKTTDAEADSVLKCETEEMKETMQTNQAYLQNAHICDRYPELTVCGGTVTPEEKLGKANN